MLPSFNFSALSLAAVVACMGSALGAKKIFCYYSSFAQTRQSIGKFLPENINPFLCTHIVYAFVDITPDGRDLTPFNRNDQGHNGLYARTLALKLKNPALKILLAVGGWQIGSKPFIPMIKNEATRSTWINNVVSYVRRHGFDGFDMDWEFPATRGSSPDDKYRFTLLMKGLYEAFVKEAETSGKEKLLLTLATASGTYYIDQSYEPSKIIHYIDYMLLMTYNYHGQWEKVTGHHSGLYPHRNDPKTGEKAQLYQEWSIDYWLDVGIPKDKLIVGLPTYGMTYTLADQNQHGVHSPVVGGGRMGDYTREMGILSYYEICLNLKDKGWKSEWIDDQAVPFAYGGNQWAGYEDKKSIAKKASNILSRNLAGAFVWSVEMDDFGDVCGQGQYPLLSTIVDIIGDRAPNQPAAREAANHYRPHHDEPAVNSGEILNKDMIRDLIESDLHLQFKKIKGRFVPDSRIKASTTVIPVMKVNSTIIAVNNSQNQQRWWSSEILKYKVKSQESQIEQKISKKPDFRVSTPKFLWKKYVIRSRQHSLKNDQKSTTVPKMANEFPSYEVHEVKSWKTTPWLSSDTDILRAVDNFDSLNARPTGRPGLGLQKEPTPEPPTDYRNTPVSRKISQAFNSAAKEKELHIDCRSLGVGTFADPRSCDHFIICMGGNWMNFPPHVMACPPGTRFDRNLKICNYASRVPCKEKND